MSTITPDGWIERNEADYLPPMTDEELCEYGWCDHAGHCEECGAVLSSGYVAMYGGSECYVGLCDLCWWARMAQYQLTYTPITQRLVSSFGKALNAAGYIT